MALINDPDLLNQGTEITIDTATLTVTLNIAGNLSADGVTGQALYSFLKEEWKTDNTKTPFRFPMESITPEQFEFVNGWEPSDDATRKLIRSAGWREVALGGATKREYMGIVTLGSIVAVSKTVGNRAYYAFGADANRTQFTYAGPVNEAIQTFGDAANGNFDSRLDSLSVFIREQGNNYGSTTSSGIGLTELNYIANRFPVSESTDLKITASDALIGSTAPYTGMSITWYGTPQSRSIGGSSYNFSIIINGNGGTKEQIYEFVQYQLRQDLDIDAGAGNENGYLTPRLLQFVGDTLKTQFAAGVGGVFIDNFDSNDTNSITFQDNTGTERTFPFVSAGTLSFSQTLVDDSAGEYWLYYTTNPAGNFDTSSAVLVQDNSGTPIAGAITGASIPFDFDYDGNTQGARTAGTDANVTLVAIGLDTAQHVIAAGTITRATGISITATAPLERNYSNP